MTRDRVWHRTILVALAVASVAVGCSRTSPSPAPGGPQSDLALLQQRTALLQQQADLVASKDFYLVFDPSKPDLALMLRGAELQRYPVLGVQVGRPRVSWRTRQESAPWQRVTWKQGALEPARLIDRLVVEGTASAKAGEEGAEPEPPPIPKTAEELYPVPMRYLIRFADGLSIEIRPREADAGLGRLARLRAWSTVKWRDVHAALFDTNTDAIRLRLVLTPKDAESLYRALPPDVHLLIL
jgi:hypothetical protein